MHGASLGHRHRRSVNVMARGAEDQADGARVASPVLAHDVVARATDEVPEHEGRHDSVVDPTDPGRNSGIRSTTMRFVTAPISRSAFDPRGTRGSPISPRNKRTRLGRSTTSSRERLASRPQQHEHREQPDDDHREDGDRASDARFSPARCRRCRGTAEGHDHGLADHAIDRHEAEARTGSPASCCGCRPSRTASPRGPSSAGNAPSAPRGRA